MRYIKPTLLRNVSRAVLGMSFLKCLATTSSPFWLMNKTVETILHPSRLEQSILSNSALFHTSYWLLELYQLCSWDPHVELDQYSISSLLDLFWVPMQFLANVCIYIGTRCLKPTQL